MSLKSSCLGLLAAAALHLPAGAVDAGAGDFRVEEVASVASVGPGGLRARTILIADGRKDPLADPATGLIRFEDWARARPAQKRALSLHPAYAEPTITVEVNGLKKPYREKLHLHVTEARFVLDRAPGSVDLARFATRAFLEKVDPSIRHEPLPASGVTPLSDPESAHNLHPDRRWCEAQAVCMRSRYQLEGKLPLGIRLANKLEEGSKKIAEFIEFESELRVVPPRELAPETVRALTGLDAPLAGAVEQNLFHVNQMMQFGKFLALIQAHPADPQKSVVTAFVALGIETDVLEKKKEFERVPVLRNLVPAQVLVGNSSFNTGTSLSAGLPVYTRNRLKAVAAMMERGA